MRQVIEQRASKRTKKMVIILIAFSSLWIHVSSVSIVTLDAPAAKEAGEELVLDCDFEFEETEATQLDLAWYFNGSPVPIYQWIPALDLGPQVIDQMFKDNLNLKYEASSDKFEKHRALHILNPDERFSGNYRCKVSSFVDEASDENDVIIYVPPNQATLNPVKEEDTNTSTISCNVRGVFPVPEVSLIWTQNLTEFTSEDLDIETNSDNPGLFDVFVATTIDIEDVVQEDLISCEIKIPGTEFNIKMESDIFEHIEPSLEPELQLEIDIFSGSASGSGEEELCESSGEADCGSGFPMEYEVVDENFNKVEMDRSTSDPVHAFEHSGVHPLISVNTAVLLFTVLICYVNTD